MHTLSCGLLICLAASGAQGHGDDQPTQQVLRAEPDGTWRMFGMFSVPRYYPSTYTFTETVPVTVPTTVEENGQTVTKNITKYQVVQKQGTRMECVLESYMASSKLRPDSIKAFETDGRKISQADLQRRIKGDTLVVVSNNGKPISNHYLSIFKPGTIVLVEFEAEHAPAAPGAAPPGVVQPVPQPLPVPNPPVTAPPQARSDVGGVIRPVAFQPEPTPRVVPNNDFPKLPASPAPEIVFLSRDGSDAIKVRQFRETQAPLTVRVGDKGAMKDVQATRTTRHSDTTSLPWNAVQISAEGKDLPLDRVKERLGTGETAGLLSKDGKDVDPFWLQNIKPTVLVVSGVQLSSAMPGGYAAPMPMAAPMPATMPLPMPVQGTRPLPKDSPPPVPPPAATTP